MPRFTVIIPTHNHTETLPYSVASVLAQTVANFELIVVGDGAPAATDAVMKRLTAADNRVAYQPHEKGPGHGEIYRHEAIAGADGDYVCYLGDDDLWLPNHLETVAETLANEDFVHTLHMNLHPEKGLQTTFGDLADPFIRKTMLNDRFNFFGPTVVGHTRAAYDRLPHGWRTKPDDLWSDLHMWRQWLSQPDIKMRTVPAVTTLHFASPVRLDWSMQQREEEIAGWSTVVATHQGRQQLTDAALKSLFEVHDSPRAYVETAKSLHAAGNVDAACRSFEKALGAPVPWIFVRYAEMLADVERVDAEFAVYQRGLEAFPDNQWLHFRRLNRLIALNELVEAERLANKHERQFQMVGQFQMIKSRICEKMGDLPGALRSAEAAAELNPSQERFARRARRLRDRTRASNKA